MAITQAVCNSFKKELLDGVHDLASGGDAFNLALYTSLATINAATTSYTTGSEVADSGQYTAKGSQLQSQETSVASGVAIVDFANLSFTGVTLSAEGALIYNSTDGKKAVCVLDFGGVKTATAGTFTIQFPAFTTSAAILRIA
tara:strand:+ start:791 stop:1219 length:429 start_codon:yes stop_codon:yes gene_type:complete